MVGGDSLTILEGFKDRFEGFLGILWRYLLSVDNPLGENAIFVSNTVAVSGQTQSGHRIQKTSGQTTQSPVTQSGVFFHLLQLFYVQTQLQNNNNE